MSGGKAEEGMGEGKERRGRSEWGEGRRGRHGGE